MGTLDAAALKFLMEYEAETPETLLRLLNRGTREVTVVEALPKLGRDIGISTRWIMLKNLRRLGVKVITGAKIKEINREGAVIEKESEDNGGAAETVLLPADTVVLAVGAVPDNDIYTRLQEKVEQLYLIGDAVSPRKLTEAIREGFTVGRQLE
jgi:2,4-dienoyl-CoA reductase (NADPH2)